MKIQSIGDTFQPLAVFAEEHNLVLFCQTFMGECCVYFRGFDVKDAHNVRGYGDTFQKAVDQYTRRINLEVLVHLESGKETYVELRGV